MDTLRRLFGKPSGAFWERHWPNRQAPLYASSLEDRLPELFAELRFSTLDELLDMHEGDFLAHGFDGLGVHQVRSRFSLKTAKELLRFGVPVQLPNIQLISPAVRALCSGLMADLGLPSSAASPIVFVSPPGRGLLKHHDVTDSFVIGLSGQKAFWVAPNHEVASPVCGVFVGTKAGGASYESAPEMPPDAQRFVVERGSCLFIPQGAWHETGAAPEGGASLSIHIERPTVLELVLQDLEARASGSGPCREPFHGVDAAGIEARVRAAAESLLRELEELTPEGACDRYLGAGNAHRP